VIRYAETKLRQNPPSRLEKYCSTAFQFVIFAQSDKMTMKF